MSTTLNTLVIAFHDNIGESLTPTANFTPATGYPLSNMADGNLFLRTRTPDLTADRQLTWDLLSAVEFNIFALFGTNASISATRRFRAADDSGFTTNVVESGASLAAAFDDTLRSGLVARYVPNYGRILIYVHPTTITKRYIRWHQTDSSNADGHMSWAMMRVGRGFQVAGGFQQWRQTTNIIGPKGSQKILRNHEYTIANLAKQEAYDLESMARVSLHSQRVLVIPETLNADTRLNDAIFCNFIGVHVKEPVPGFSDQRYKTVLQFEEVER